MLPDRNKRPITDIESDLLDFLLKCPQIDPQQHLTTPDSNDYYRELDLLDLRDENFQARSPAFFTKLQSSWTDIDSVSSESHT
jgi:Ran GTPase-activating protein (RanGAP) involved in mRNA processing and transport